MSIAVSDVALEGETHEIHEDDIRPLSPISPTAKRMRAEIGLLDALTMPDMAEEEEEAEPDEVRPMSPPRGDSLMLRSLINGETRSMGTPFLGLAVPVGDASEGVVLDKRSKPVYGLLSEEGGLAAYNDKLKQDELRRKGSGKARAYG